MKAELKINSVNQIVKDTDIYLEGEQASSIALVVKGRIRISSKGVNLVVGSGNFLGLCDLIDGSHKVSYAADSNAVVYAFPGMQFNQAVTRLIKVNKDYAALIYSTLNRYIRELAKIYESTRDMIERLSSFLKDANEKYAAIAKNAGVRVNEVEDAGLVSDVKTGTDIDVDKIEYYKACSEIPAEIQKSFINANPVLPVYHISDQAKLINLLIERCAENAAYLEKIAGPLVKNKKSLYMGVLQLATALQRMDEDALDATSLFDDVIDSINSLEKLLIDKCGIDLEIDHDFMEDAYFKLINSGGEKGADLEQTALNSQSLDNALDCILEYSEADEQTADQFRDCIERFLRLQDKASTDDDVRTLRRNIAKGFYDIYKKAFLKDHDSPDGAPLAVDLFLKYGFVSEKLLTDEMLSELLSLNESSSELGSCEVYTMKDWLARIYEGKDEPSKSEFDLDYSENLRDMRKTGRITAEEEQKLSRDNNAKLDYEIQNMFKANHRIIYGQVSIFVPILYSEGCSGSLQRCRLTKDKINSAVNRLLQIDYSVFYRESLYTGKDEHIKKEYVMEEVFPDFILFPAFGSNGVMWQELSGRRRNSKGRFLLPAFLDTDLNTVMIKLFGRFRWELCRTMQGAAWNNIQIKSLTSEYSDFIQFYRKNRELSDDKKDKLKMQIQKCRNNTREVFVIDYENWIKQEANGGLVLSKPVREILATYCPFVKELREKVSDQPLFKDAMARFIRERGKKTKEYDMKFRVWQKDGVKIPEQIIETRDFYVNM